MGETDRKEAAEEVAAAAAGAEAGVLRTPDASCLVQPEEKGDGVEPEESAVWEVMREDRPLESSACKAPVRYETASSRAETEDWVEMGAGEALEVPARMAWPVKRPRLARMAGGEGVVEPVAWEDREAAAQAGLPGALS